MNSIQVERALQTPQAARQMRRLYDRYDLLCDAQRYVEWAKAALEECRDADYSEQAATLEQIGGELRRETDAAHARLEKLEALEQAALNREARE